MLIFLDANGNKVSLDDPSAFIAEIKVQTLETEPMYEQLSLFNKIDEKELQMQIQMLKEIFEELAEKTKEAVQTLADAIADYPKKVEAKDREYCEDEEFDASLALIPQLMYAAEYVTEPVFLPP